MQPKDQEHFRWSRYHHYPTLSCLARCTLLQELHFEVIWNLFCLKYHFQDRIISLLKLKQHISSLCHQEIEKHCHNSYCLHLHFLNYSQISQRCPIRYHFQIVALKLFLLHLPLQNALFLLSFFLRIFLWLTLLVFCIIPSVIHHFHLPINLLNLPLN